MSAMKVYDSSIRQIPVISQVKSIYENRGLLRLLVVRDLTVRYKRSIIGVWWSLLNPLFTTAVLYYVFNTVFKSKLPGGAPFLPYLLSGVLLITLFNQGLTLGADAISTGAGVLTKVYVRPEIFAASASISSAINFLIGLVPLTIVLAIYHKTPTWHFPMVILVMFFMTLFTTGLSLLLAIAYINFDDSRSLVAIFLTAVQYMTPVFYPITLLGPHTREVIQLNPLYSFLQIFRREFGNVGVSNLHNWEIMGATSVIAFVGGFYIFSKSWPKVVAKL